MVKRSKIDIQQPQTKENSNIFYLKPHTIEHQKTSRKLSKAIRHDKMVSQLDGSGRNSACPLHSEAIKSDEERTTKTRK